MTQWILLFAILFVGGIVLLLVLYGKLLSQLKRHNPEVFLAIGSPSLFMHSPRRGMQLQRFIYRGSQQPHIHPDVAKLSRWLGILTPLFVAAAIGGLLWIPSQLLETI